MANLSAFGGAQPITPGGLVELGYVERTTNQSVTATTFSGASEVFATDLTFVADGSPVLVEFYCPQVSVGGNYIVINLSNGGSTDMGQISYSAVSMAVNTQYRYTPSAGSQTLNVRAWVQSGTGQVSSGAGGSGQYPPTFLRVSKIVQQNDGLKPFWTPPITASLPSNPDTGDQIIYKHGGTGNIGSHLPMIYDGTKWQPAGEAVLCRWNCGSATQVFSSTSATNVTTGDYNTVTFTPPWDGYYEVSQKTGKWELNTGIGMFTNFSATDGSVHHQLHYAEDWNGPYQHHREGHGMPIAVYLYSAKTYRFTAAITYAAGNTGTINFSGTAHVRALSL